MTEKKRPKRIFWLGMHKILRKTELPALRALGYEVFSPAYLAPIYDQSADLTIDLDQETTLPDEIFQKLIATNFFYSEISDDVAEILNQWFDCVIVTINPDWLGSVLAAYGGRVIYRIYGQPYSLSEHFGANDKWRLLSTRGELAIIPFAEESVRYEEPWLRALCTPAVPYQIPDDVFEHSERWDRLTSSRSSEIAVSIPNIEHPYYSNAYQAFSEYPETHFRIYGPQRTIPADPRIIGELPRASYLNALARSAGYFYPYTDRVCYLPPIEMMELGGPVVVMAGSLLADFFEDGAPNIATSTPEAKAKLARLLAGDRRFAASLIAAQDVVRRRYDRKIVGQAISRHLPDAIEGRTVPKAPYCIDEGRVAKVYARDNDNDDLDGAQAATSLLIALHVNGFFHLRDGKAIALEGIPRVMEHLVTASAARTTLPVVITAQPEGARATLAVFHDLLMKGLVHVLIVGTKNDTPAGRLLNRMELIRLLNTNDNAVSVLVPHYYLFPEFLLYEGMMSLFLFDYMPHLFPDEVFEDEFRDDLNLKIGRAIGRKSSVIFTGSQFTANYLPQSAIVDDLANNKIVVAPLPMLGHHRPAGSTSVRADARLGHLIPKQFLFYPTANRPNKQLSFLLRVFATLRLDNPELKILLTCDLNSYPAVQVIADEYGLMKHITLAPALAEEDMRWAYANCAALSFTSAGEGNFPPQVLEAMNCGAPVVASRLSAITDELQGYAAQLLLCEPGDLTEFVRALKYSISNRSLVLRQQKPALDHLLNLHGLKQFAETMMGALPGKIATQH